MKKTTKLLLAFMLIGSLAACGGDVTPNTNEETSTSENGKSVTKSEISFTEMVAVDNEECFVKITGIDPDNMFGYSLKAELENKSAEKTYMFSVENAYVNGVKCDPFFATEVAAGKKSNNDISFTDNAFKGNDVGDFTDIEITFRVSDSEDWEAEPVARETVHIYPYGEDKVTKYMRESQPTDNVIVDNEYVTVIDLGYNEDDILGKGFNVYWINKSDKNVMFSIDEASVNGYMVDPFYATSIAAGKCEFAFVGWMSEALEENGIADIETIEFKLRAYDEDNFTGDYLVDEMVTINR